MTADEARSVAHIACGADGECCVCAEKLVGDLKRAWPDHADTFQDVYDERFTR